MDVNGAAGAVKLQSINSRWHFLPRIAVLEPSRTMQLASTVYLARQLQSEFGLRRIRRFYGFDGGADYPL